MNKSEKEQAVAELHEKMKKATFAVAVSFDKLDANTTIELRRLMRAGQIDYKVVKNTLALRAAKGTQVEKLASHFAGPVAVALGYGEIIATAKACDAAFKKAPEKVKVKGVVADGEVHDAAGFEALAKLPGLPEIRATLLALINTPASSIARAIKAHVDKQSGPPAEAA